MDARLKCAMSGKGRDVLCTLMEISCWLVFRWVLPCDLGI